MDFELDEFRQDVLGLLDHYGLIDAKEDMPYCEFSFADDGEQREINIEIVLEI